MIHIEPHALNDADRKTLNDWLNAPGRLIYQRVLASDAAGKMASAVNKLVKNDGGDKEDAEELIEGARIIVAANDLLINILPKETLIEMVELKPQPQIKNDSNP